MTNATGFAGARCERSRNFYRHHFLTRTAIMRFALLANLRHTAIKEYLPPWLAWLSRRAEVVVADDLAPFLNLPRARVTVAPRAQVFHGCDMAISLGGDGTILATAHMIGRAGVPILGVKFGGLGFLVEIGPEEFYPALESILAGNYEIQSRMVLQARLASEGAPAPLFAMNDFVIDRGGHYRLVRLMTHINNEFLNTYIADGLIIATPTGSTAYSLSAGGPILSPEMNAMVITPICPHSLSARPVVIPDEKTVRVELTGGEFPIHLAADGQTVRALTPGTPVEIRKADFDIRLVRKTGPHSAGFYDTLRAKLHWGEDERK